MIVPKKLKPNNLKPKQIQQRQLLSKLLGTLGLTGGILAGSALPALSQNIFYWEADPNIPAGYSPAGGAEWNVDDTNRTYTNVGGSGIDVNVQLLDPANQNLDSNNVGTANIATQTNSSIFGGAGRFTAGMTSQNSNQEVSLIFTFSQPVLLQDFLIGDIDSLGGNAGSPNGFQDEIRFSASDQNNNNVPVTLFYPSGINSSIVIISNQTQTARAFYRSDLNLNRDPADPSSHVLASPQAAITQIRIDYSNGPDDDGVSDDHAIMVGLEGGLFEFEAAPLDYSDAPADGGTAPDGNGTTGYGEASHVIVNGTRLGANIDAETAAQNSSNADGDDSDGTDDDDGVTIPTLIPGQTATITADVSGTGGYLQGWIDWDGNGSFNSGEQIATNLQDNGTGDTNQTAGTIDFDVDVPVGAIIGTDTFARFRWSTTQNLDTTTAASDGEVEDYQIAIAPPLIYDYGDAPDASRGTERGNYQTTANDNGAAQVVINTNGLILSLGNDVDIDNGTLQNPEADADDISGSPDPGDEDGVESFPTLTTAENQTYTVPVTVRNNITGVDAFLVGYIDFNRDGDFDDTGEQSTQTVTIPPNLTGDPQQVEVSFTTPAGMTPGDTYARFRLGQIKATAESATGASTSTDNGEIEDYQIAIASPLITGNVCYSVADYNDTLNNGSDTLTKIDRLTGAEVSVGGTGTNNIEAIAYSPLTNTLYATDAGAFGRINTSTGNFVEIGTVGSSFGDIDGLTVDPYTGQVYGSVRRTNGSADLLIEINPTTGQFIPGAFNGNDSVPIQIPTGTTLDDIDDITIDPEDGQLYGIANQDGGTDDAYVRINRTDGTTNRIGSFNIRDVEGLTAFNDGNIYMTTGNRGLSATNDTFFSVDKASGQANTIDSAPLNVGSDYESVACLTGPPNAVSGRVFLDGNNNGTNDSESGTENVTVELYRDVNNDGTVDDGDILLTTQATNSDGDYNFLFAATGAYVLAIDPATLPAGNTLTTDNLETANLNGLALSDTDNDFGYGAASESSISGTVYEDFGAGGDNNNTFDNGEGTIGDVSVNLFEDNNNDNQPDGAAVQTVDTDSTTGAYQFTNVASGKYLIRVDTRDTDIPNTYAIGTPNPIQIDLSGTDITDRDFGFNTVSKTCPSGSFLSEQTFLDFQNPTAEPGTVNGNYNVGAVYRFANVTADIDALVEITALNNATLARIDRSDFGVISAFQPEVRANSTNAGEYSVDFNIDFVQSGTTTPVELRRVLATGIDIDGDSGGVREASELGGNQFTTYAIDNNSRLTATELSSDRIKFESTTSFNLADITVNSLNQGSAYYDNSTQSIEYRAGLIIDPNATNPANQRLTSLLFDCVSYDLPITNNASLLLVKRITAINPGQSGEVRFNSFVDDPNNPNDNAQDWPDNDNLYLPGRIGVADIQPGDEVEYTIYFLAYGGTAAENVQICDVIPNNMTFAKDFYEVEKGIGLELTTSNPPSANPPSEILSNAIGDEAGTDDIAQGAFFAPGTTPNTDPANLCKKPDFSDNSNSPALVNVDSDNNTSGAVWIQLNNSLPSATSAGTPNNSYGFIRFRTKVK